MSPLLNTGTKGLVYDAKRQLYFSNPFHYPFGFRSDFETEKHVQPGRFLFGTFERSGVCTDTRCVFLFAAGFTGYGFCSAVSDYDKAPLAAAISFEVSAGGDVFGNGARDRDQEWVSS